jgi:hypothetical protein
MDFLKFISGKRALVLVGCLALLYFAAGGIFLHQHTGPDTVCPVCQALHMPALAAAPGPTFTQPQQVAGQAAPLVVASPLDSFAVHRASRAPPSA